ncbi:DNA-binding protein [Cellulomonas flavigena DSM 20109]|uniref:DNA-binding protein n=1 Tax=Cellulomonas flavigena (strain ATCC 482 / DSM 20109 / BCRC 11376 / JCM 18109 / NBRC 3775 / NCIMB 8073 / NRS 134) TaxID=446466 RepID=D5UED5_CELFN|nr:septation protein SepH [Cellulomonas flavigena]ADG74595.1 DNA-binding protein [Cellulomonas flavigena DSM 20109]
MGELELVGLHEDGEHLVLVAPDGQRFRLRIDDPLRAAVRRDRPQLEQLRAEQAGALSPREIQSRIRAGATAQEVADAAGVPVEAVRRYEGPVLAEREYVAEQAQATRVGRDSGAPLLGELVTDRLAARGVDVASLSWDAAREGTGPWAVLARFVVADEPRVARWTYDPVRRTVVADEDEARWLSETEIDEPVSRRHLAAVRDVVFDLAAVDAVPEEPEPTHALLDELRTRRGVRQPLDLDGPDEEFEGFGPQHAFDFGPAGPADEAPAVDEASAPGAHPVDADPAREAVVLTPARGERQAPRSAAADRAASDRAAPERPAPERATPARPARASSQASGADDEPEAAAGDAHPAAAERRPRRTRAKVPSWDEIVFGAKPE